MKPIATLSRTQDILTRYQLHAKKKFGQNFIIEPTIIDRIVRNANLDNQTAVIEVGPGIGALSEGLAKASKEVWAYEIDQDMIEILKETMGQYPNFKVIGQDFLKADLKEALSSLKDSKIKLVANLPYYITAKLLEKIALEGEGILEVIVMVQKDVALKMTSSQDLRDRLPLTLFLHSIAEVKVLFDVGRSVFLPSPNVDSSILSIRFQEVCDIENKERYYHFLQVAFKARRKRLTNNLKNISFDQPLSELLEELHTSVDVRAEQLTIEQLKDLYRHVTLFPF